LRRVQRKLVSPAPHRPALWARLRSVWRHLPKGGVLGFCDVNPGVVKASGGRRYPAAKRLVWARHHKSRGTLYLLAAYEVRTGRVRWLCLPATDSPQVCAVRRGVRRG
jgi:hypothetical protein